jgi:putative radical SAM enzyme (TIGR03279 family)
MVRVSRVLPGSIAEELGIVPGTELVSVNGQELADFLDWEFLAADPELTVEARLPDGTEVVYEIERDDAVAIGVELEPPNIRRCANRCEFCFIEGLPKGLRRSLYVRDDDYRLSFAYGNFATLSNMKDRDVERILRYRLSPLYVSVHATAWEARKVLLNNPRVPNIVEQLTRLAAGGIQFHCQMVVVPGLNDGDVLEASLTDLWTFGESVMSVALVPVGLTQFSHLYTGKSMGPDDAARILDAAERWGARAREQRGDTWVYGSDELYMLAGRELPGAGFYGDFAQIENGVGAVAALRQRVRAGIARGLPRLDGAQIGVVTGVSMTPLMRELLDELTAATGAQFMLLSAVNSLFGPTVTTAGLLVSHDIRGALAGVDGLDAALIPAETLNDNGVFLDDVPLDAVRAAFAMPIHASYDFVDILSRPKVLRALNTPQAV